MENIMKNQKQVHMFQTAAAAVHAAFFMEGLIVHAGLLNCVEAWDSGCIELVSNMTEYTDCVQDMLRAVNEYNPNVEYPGVFDYEVSSYFGKWFGEHVIVNSDVPSTKLAEEWITKEIIAFFSQAMSKHESVELAAVLNNLCLYRAM